MRRVLIPFMLAALFLVSPATSAAAASSAQGTVRIGDTGQLSEDGTTITVPLTYTCDPSLDYVLFEFYIEQDENKGATVIGYPELQCDGEPHTINAVVECRSGCAFHEGTATAKVRALFCRSQVPSCIYVPKYRVIQVV